MHSIICIVWKTLYLCGLDSVELDSILDDFLVVQVAGHCELTHQAFHVPTCLQAEKVGFLSLQLCSIDNQKCSMGEGRYIDN